MRSEIYIKYGGAVFLLLVSSLILFSPTPNVFIPLPIHLGILLYFLKPIAPLILPLTYLLFLVFFSRLKYFGYIILILLLIVTILSIAYFYSFWNDGIQVQGIGFLLTVILENIFLFALSAILALKGIKEKSTKLFYYSVFIFFFAISWCAFPILGLFP